ncbi:2-C-methyl-D-erythritol 4-phosphate cytidylyltransferase [Candidatus Peregrinibacteria bacterium]|nr:2-C-methyl-D-erythritol 4-phosphate cytidylyltransferase [Candidatus Peregrinibacteria bacterium]
MSINSFVIIVAAGKSRRFKKKLFREIDGKKILVYTLEAFEKHPSIHHVIIVVRNEEQKEIKKMLREEGIKKVKALVNGGETRQKSVKKGLEWLIKVKKPKKNDIIMIHNGANPLVSQKEITDVLMAAQSFGAAACGVSLVDTIKKVKGGFVQKTILRENLAVMQTPQALRFDWLVEGMKKAEKEGKIFTDDVSLVEQLGKKVKIVQAREENKKITFESDILYMRRIIENRKRLKNIALNKEKGKNNDDKKDQKRENDKNELKMICNNIKKWLIKKENNTNYSFGIGEDSHVFSNEKGLTLGGIYFPYYQKLDANSDGDIIIHALFNALSSAIGGDSLGKTADSLFQHQLIKDSTVYLKPLLEVMQKRNLKVSHLAISLITQKPKIDDHAKEIKDSLSNILKMPNNHIGLTATSGEGLPDWKKVMKCTCVALLEKKK